MAAEFLLLSGASVTPDHGPVQEVADADGKRNNAERSDCPDVAIRLNACNQSKSSNVAERAADEQDAGATGVSRLVQFRLQMDVDSASNRRKPFFATQFANPVIGIQRAEGDSHPQNHGH